jgi:hypothetical protein
MWRHPGTDSHSHSQTLPLPASSDGSGAGLTVKPPAVLGEPVIASPNGLHMSTTSTVLTPTPTRAFAVAAGNHTQPSRARKRRSSSPPNASVARARANITSTASGRRPGTVVDAQLDDQHLRPWQHRLHLSTRRSASPRVRSVCLSPLR